MFGKGEIINIMREQSVIYSGKLISCVVLSLLALSIDNFLGNKVFGT